MFLIYRIVINFVLVLSPIIILLRIIKKKEDILRFKEKFGFFKKKRIKGNLIWFHGASVGELNSVIPVIKKLSLNPNIKQILVTSNTLSSSKIIKKICNKKVFHQFFPLDTNIISKNFINYWQPSKAIFVDSEIWPNMINNLKKKNINIYLLNGRLSKKSFKRWLFFKNFSSKVFSKFDLCLTSNKETVNYLKKLSAKNVKFIGNLKFAESDSKNFYLEPKLKKFFSKKKIWCASSTHNSEEIICGKVHLELKKKIKNLLTIIIPRHIERNNKIRLDLEKLGLKVHLDTSSKSINQHTDIYLVNHYGKTKLYFNQAIVVFLGGSIIKHGGQNPLEAARLGAHILTGPNTHNFTDIYKFLKKNKISQKVTNKRDLIKKLCPLLTKKTCSKNKIDKIDVLGDKILKKTYNELNL